MWSRSKREYQPKEKGERVTTEDIAFFLLVLVIIIAWFASH